MSTSTTRDDNPIDRVAQIDEFDNIDCDDDTGRLIESLCATIDGLCDTVGGLQDRLSELENDNEQLQETVDDQAELIDELEQETEINGSRLDALTDASIETDESIDDQQDQIESIENEQDILDNRLTAISDGLERLEANDGDATPGCEGDNDGNTTIEYAEPKTPLELLLDDPQNSGIRITPSVDRALKIASHIEEWSERAPAGRVIKDGLKRLLSTVEEETLAWRQIYRACHKLDDLTNGRIAFEKTDQHGRVLVMRDEQYLTRVVSHGGGEG